MLLCERLVFEENRRIANELSPKLQAEIVQAHYRRLQMEATWEFEDRLQAARDEQWARITK